MSEMAANSALANIQTTRMQKWTSWVEAAKDMETLAHVRSGRQWTQQPKNKPKVVGERVLIQTSNIIETWRHLLKMANG